MHLKHSRKRLCPSHDPIQILLVSLVALFLLYYIALGIDIGFWASNLYVWLFLCFGLLSLFFLRIAEQCGLLRIPKWVRISFYILLSAICCLFLWVEGCILSEFKATAPPNVDYILVLGAKVNGESPSPTLSNRIDAAYDYLAQNPNTVCIATGGKEDDEMISEAECIKRTLVAKGIESERIFTEDRSTDTFENVQFGKEWIRDIHCSVAVVSSDFHLFRGQALVSHLGFSDVYGIPCTTSIKLLPHYLVREFVSVIVDSCQGNMSLLR